MWQMSPLAGKGLTFKEDREAYDKSMGCAADQVLHCQHINQNHFFSRWRCAGLSGGTVLRRNYCLWCYPCVFFFKFIIVYLLTIMNTNWTRIIMKTNCEKGYKKVIEKWWKYK